MVPNIWRRPGAIQVIDSIFIFIFLGELLLRVAVERLDWLKAQLRLGKAGTIGPLLHKVSHFPTTPYTYTSSRTSSEGVTRPSLHPGPQSHRTETVRYDWRPNGTRDPTKLKSFSAETVRSRAPTYVKRLICVYARRSSFVRAWA